MRKWCAPAILTLALAAGSGLASAVMAQTPAPAADQTQAVLAAVKTALGGDAKLATLKSLSAEGSERRVLGGQDRTSDVELALVFPDHIQRIEQMELPTGMMGPRFAQTLNGEEFWMGSLDPMPAGMMRFAGGGDAGGPGGGAPGAGGAGAPGQAGGGRGQGRGPGGPGQGGARMGQQIKVELLRTLVGFLPVPSLLPANVTFAYAGDAKSADGGSADVLDVKSPELQAKLFIDKQTHLPLMLTFQAPDPSAAAARMAAFQRKQGESEEDWRKRVDEERQKLQAQGPPPPPPQVEHQVYFAEFKKFDGVMFPTRISRAANGKTTQELELKKVKLNPKIDLARFQQKKGS